MAQDLGQDIATEAPNVTVPTSDLADGTRSALFPSTAVDLGDPTPLELACEWQQVALAGGTSNAMLFAHWSNDNTDFSNDDNGEPIEVIKCNGTTTVKKCFSFKVRMRYLKFTILNEAGASLDFTASDSDITIWDNFGNQV